jgi:hypothetical protein
MAQTLGYLVQVRTGQNRRETGQEMSQGDKLAATGIALALSFLLFFVKIVWPLWLAAGF